MPCWSLFHSNRKPLFAGLGDGFRTLQGWLVHPDTKALIPETACGLRAVVTYATLTPDGVDDVDIDGVPDDDADAAGDDGGWEEYFDETYNANYYFHRPTNESSWGLPNRFRAPIREPKTTYVDLDIDGLRRVFPVQRGSDASVAATRICQGYGILNWHCIDAITEKIERGVRDDDQGPILPPPPPPPRPSVVPDAPTQPGQPGPPASADGALPNPLASDARAIAPPAKTPMERLKDLKALYEANLISDEQMEAKREAILATL